jgi:hypothetical protein
MCSPKPDDHEAAQSAAVNSCRSEEWAAGDSPATGQGEIRKVVHTTELPSEEIADQVKSKCRSVDKVR